MSAARKAAEEALAEWDAVPSRLSEEERTALVHCASALRALLADEDERGEELRRAIEIEREGQRSMARTLNEINRLSRLDVAINLARPGAGR